MFNWLRRRRAARARAIFRYFDGQQSRAIDPLLALRAMQLHPKFDPAVHLSQCDDGDPEAIGTTVAAMQEIFGLKPFDQGGLTEAETLALVGDFNAYLSDLKKNGSPSPTLPGATDSTPALGPAVASPSTNAL